jgi:NAD(P)-dependent dehydrogenase (short-subunit alcohol dehydrogenase family)
LSKKNSVDKFIDFSFFQKKKRLFNSDEFAIVTGGCGRIGSIYTSLFLLYGIKVIVLSRTNKNFLDFSSNLNSDLRKKIFWKKLDLRKGTSIESIAKFLKNKKIKFLVNNAAYSNRGKFFSYNQKNLNEELWGTFAGSMLLTEKILPRLRKNKNSKIIFTGSLWGKKTPRFKIYKDLDIGPSPIIASGKSAILQYSKFLAEREAVYGITVNSLLPGWFPRKGKIERKDYINRIKSNIPLNRIGKLSDLISAIDFLISQETSYITGQELVIDGGYSLS